jgi:hypothetical protein
MRRPIFAPLNHSMQRMRASRLAHLQLGSPERLARTADAERYAPAGATVEETLLDAAKSTLR